MNPSIFVGASLAIAIMAFVDFNNRIKKRKVLKSALLLGASFILSTILSTFVVVHAIGVTDAELIGQFTGGFMGAVVTILAFLTTRIKVKVV